MSFLDEMYARSLKDREFINFVTRRVNENTAPELGAMWRREYYALHPDQKTGPVKFTRDYQLARDAAIKLGAATGPRQLIERLRREGIYNDRRRKADADDAEWNSLPQDVKEAVGGRDGWGTLDGEARAAMVANAYAAVARLKSIRNQEAEAALAQSREKEAAEEAQRKKEKEEAAALKLKIGVGVAVVAALGVSYFVFVKK